MQKKGFWIATYRNVFDRQTKCVRVTHHALEKALTSFRMVGDVEKTAVKCWSPTRYNWVPDPNNTHEAIADGTYTDKKGQTRTRWTEVERPVSERGFWENRGRKGVALVTCLVFDYDDGTSLDTARAPWMDYNHCWHSSISHSEALPKFRLIIFLDEPIEAEHWSKVWHWAIGKAGGSPDRACKDPSRIYLVPAVRSKEQPTLAGCHETGKFLSIDHTDIPNQNGTRTMYVRKTPRRQLKGPVGLVLREVRARLKHDPASRERAASMLGAQSNGDRVWGIRCPKCGRDSVWFLLEPGPHKGAECNHKNSCGWFGWLDELLDENGVQANG